VLRLTHQWAAIVPFSGNWDERFSTRSANRWYGGMKQTFLAWLDDELAKEE
jgi:hypothetical protein